MSDELLAFDDVSNRLGLVSQAYAGVRPIPIDRIVGSVDRSKEFDRQFRPRKRHLLPRIRGVARAFPGGAVPPIDVYEVGGLYFVADGHKRVATARAQGAAAVDAAIVHVETAYELPPDVDVCRLIHTEQHRLFLEASGLAAAMPGIEITFSRPQGYPELLEVIWAHGYHVMQERGRVLSDAEVAASFLDEHYRPGVTALREAGLPDVYTWKTEADLFLWVHQVRRTLIATDPTAGYEEAALAARARPVDRRFRRQFLREKTAPLSPRRR